MSLSRPRSLATRFGADGEGQKVTQSAMETQIVFHLPDCFTGTSGCRRLAIAIALSSLLTVSALGQVQYPVDVAVAPDGTVYVADLNLPGIWKVKDGKAEVYFQAEKRFRTPLNRVRCLAVDQQGRLLAGDSSTWEVYRFNQDGKPEPLAQGKIGKPMSLAVAKDGTIYVADLEVHRIWKLRDGEAPQEVAALVAPVGIALDPQNRIWVVSRGKHQVRRVTPEGKLEVVVEDRPFAFPHDICLLPSGQAVVSDGYGKCLWRITEGQPPEKWAAVPAFDNPVGIAEHGGKIYVADSRAKMVFVVDGDGNVTPLWK